MTTPAPKEQTVPDSEKTESVKAEPKEKCVNHPDRDGTRYDDGKSYNVVFCDECVPPWFL